MNSTRTPSELNPAEIRRALNAKQKKIDPRKLPAELPATASSAEIAAAVNKIVEALK